MSRSGDIRAPSSGGLISNLSWFSSIKTRKTICARFSESRLAKKAQIGHSTEEEWEHDSISLVPHFLHFSVVDTCHIQ